MIMTENRSILMKRRQLFHLILITGFSSFTVGSSEFHFINDAKTYEEAKTYCRETYTDLATVHNLTDMKNLTTLLPKSTDGKLIGLDDACEASDQGSDSHCGNWRSFVCRGNRRSSLPISWKTYCRNIISGENNQSTSQIVWIGLMNDPCGLLDGSSPSLCQWKPCQPNNVNHHDCTKDILNCEGKGNKNNCKKKFKFICQAARKLNPTTTRLPTTQKTTTTSQLPTYATTLPNTSPQEVTTTLTSTTPTKQQTTTKVTTEEETTATDTTTADTTDVVHSTSSTAVNNTTHEPVTTTTQSTTQLSTLTSSGNNQSVPPGNLILIQLNLTWIDAMAYCRAHHYNLVQVTSSQIQEEAAEKAKNATSPHVWLGLRYTCKLKFWFWTRPMSTCYQNWAMGEGPAKTYDCGFTGAIQATGGQWVGLHETDRLNFICSVCAG
ncbi:uncharacterized protein LOC128439612 [Pleuronectes platessa]|uniref:uncharacterized protein LOC128439612 n=1 Tax=Pleuronectes platessa TaxID=8262 RepID=UPI00232A6484|nr:uncharacterized protein LOC128439612 [Pleuronectes platessa]